VALYEIIERAELDAPVLVGALEGWVDAGGTASATVAFLTADSEEIAAFDTEALYDYRVNRPTLDIVDGTMQRLEWPALTVRLVRNPKRALLVLSGPEPHMRWKEFSASVVDLALDLGAVGWVSLGAIAAAVPHTRATPLIATASKPELLKEEDRLPPGLLRVPAAAITTIELAFAEQGLPSVGFWAQVPHYIPEPYLPAVATILQRLARHLGVELALDELIELGEAQRQKLNELVSQRPEAEAYLEQLERMASTERVPSGEEIAAEVERFLADQERGDNPFEG
jgi:predicted ATP-grasp superfamily ATP-dependent carboligase